MFYLVSDNGRLVGVEPSTTHPGQPRRSLRQGVERPRLRSPPRPPHHPPRAAGGRTAPRFLGRGHRPGGLTPEERPGAPRRRCGDVLLVRQGDQRGELPPHEAGPGGVRHQQRGPLRPALPLLHRGGTGRDLRFRGNDQLHRLLRHGRPHLRHRLQHHRAAPPHRHPDHHRGPARRPAHRRRQPPHPPRPPCRPAPAPPERHRRGPPERHDARDHRRGAGRPRFHRRPARKDIRNWRRQWPTGPRNGPPPLPGSPPGRSSPRPASMPGPGPPCSSTPWGSPSTATAWTTSAAAPTWRCSPATWGAPAAASTRSAARTTSRGGATWGRFPTCTAGTRR